MTASPQPDWRPHFDYRGNYRSVCRLCGRELDNRAGRPLKHLKSKHADALRPAPGGTEGAPPPTSAPAPPASPPSQATSGSREELLDGLWADSRNAALTATERARARELIAKVEGYAEEKEADPDDTRRRHLRRVEEAMERQGGSENELLTILCDATNGRAARVWLRDLLDRAETLAS